MAKESRRWYYVSCYEEYPIYEPAEGGYYYAGNELIESYRFGSFKRAKRWLAKLVSDFEGSCDAYRVVRDTFAVRDGAHIGESSTIRVETVMGCHEAGKRIYH